MNGEQFNEEGKFKTVHGMDVIVTKGSYTIVEKDGSITVVNYYADEHGFHPEVGEFMSFRLLIIYHYYSKNTDLYKIIIVSVTSSPVQG